MHHHIVVKVWAEDAEEAESQVRSAMEDSISPEYDNTGWDYFDSANLITKEMLGQQFSSLQTYTSYKELEENKIKERHDSLQDLMSKIKEELIVMVAPYFLSKAEAPLYVNTENEDLKKYVEKLLKQKKDVKKPDSFESIVEVLTKVVTSIAKKDTGHSLAMYHMEQIKKLQYCIESPLELNYTLQSFENPYAEIPCNDKKGLSPYYFLCDRHF